MADISKLEQQADLLVSNVSGWETSTLERIGKRIKRYGKLSLADVESINNIATVKQDMDAITKELAKVTGYNISQIEQMYGELLEEQHLANEPLYDYRGKKFVPFAENRELQAIARAYAKTTGETMINLAKTKALCVLDHNGNVKGLQKAYTDVLDKAVMQVTSGTTDFHTAMRDSIIELGGSGVRVDYGEQIVKGKKMRVTRRLDTVVRQNLLWGAKQASVEYNEMIGEELGCDGYEVDWHSNPRPSHEFMQGKQFVVGKAKTINGVHFDSFDEANKRLQDYGCLHYKTPIICGVSEPRYSPEELKRLNEQNARQYTIDGKEYSGYEVTQMQRRLESSVRNEKTTRDLAKASGDNALVKRCNKRIKAYQTKYNEISEITGIQGDKKRMSVPRSMATVKSATPTQQKIVSAKTQETLMSKGFSEISAKSVQEKINDLGKVQKEKWEKAFAETKYVIDNDSPAQYSVVKKEVTIGESVSSSKLFHETAHAIDKGSVDIIIDEGQPWSFKIDSASGYLSEKLSLYGYDSGRFAEMIGASVDEYGRVVDSADTIIKFNEWAKNEAKKMGVTIGDESFGQLTDIFSGLTDDRIKSSLTYGGHDGSYWMSPREDASSFCVEAWADYCSLRASGSQAVLQLLDDSLPNVSKALKEVYMEVFGE